MTKTTLSKIRKLLREPCFTACQARKEGVTSSQLAYYVHKGEIERVSRGVYRGPEEHRKMAPFEWEDLITTVTSTPNGRICLVSALAIYELTDEIPRQFWIAIPHSQFAPKRPKAKIIRMRDVRTGVATLKFGRISVPTFNKERTVLDSFRYLSKETAIKALKEYLSGRHGKPDLAKLRQYSLKLKIPIEHYVEAFTT